ncbi:unnamed protein product, partial [Echinostoma caproni]
MNSVCHFQPWSSLNFVRTFSTTSGKGGQGSDGGEDPPADAPTPGSGSEGTAPPPESPAHPQLALSTQNVPDTFPLVPVIAITGAPLFPKFVKMIEITDERLINLLRRKIKLHTPYAGVFLKRSSTEIQLVRQVDENTAFITDAPSSSVSRHKRNGFTRRAKRVAAAITGKEEFPEAADTAAESDVTKPASDADVLLDDHPSMPPSPVLMAETINVYHDPYETTQEIK